MDNYLTTLLPRLKMAGHAGSPVTQVTFTRDELNILIRVLSVHTETPAASLIITTHESGAVSHAVNYGWDEEEKQRTEQYGGQYIPLFRYDLSD